MIEEIFLSTLEGNILVGNSKLMPLNPVYPVYEFNGKKLTQLKTNDVILSILYMAIDDFKASKYLYNLQMFLKTKIGKISTNNINKNFITIIEELQKFKGYEYSNSEFTKNIIKQKNIYIDIIESVYTNINKKGEVVRNIILGNILTCENIDIKIKKSIKEKVLFKSSHEMIDDLNIIEFKIRNIQEKKSLCSYQINNINFTYIKMKKEGNTYRFFTDKKIFMKYIKFTIPVEEDTFHVDVIHKEGIHLFKINEKIVEWEIHNYDFLDECITINILNYKDFGNNKRPIIVDFLFYSDKSEIISIESCKCNEFLLNNVFAKFVVQSGSYEFE